jgi:hypothetical protein
MGQYPGLVVRLALLALAVRDARAWPVLFNGNGSSALSSAYGGHVLLAPDTGGARRAARPPPGPRSRTCRLHQGEPGVCLSLPCKAVQSEPSASGR